MENLSLGLRISKVIEESKGLKISKKKVESLIKEYNDFKMPISERAKEIYNNPTDFINFILSQNC